MQMAGLQRVAGVLNEVGLHPKDLIYHLMDIYSLVRWSHKVIQFHSIALTHLSYFKLLATT
jgi:hypothetical protein